MLKMPQGWTLLYVRQEAVEWVGEVADGKRQDSNPHEPQESDAAHQSVHTMVNRFDGPSAGQFVTFMASTAFLI